MSISDLQPAFRLSLNSVELLEYSQLVAAEVAAGRYPFIEYDAQDRWHQRIYRDQRVDVWLISWMPSQGTQLHDHGGSSGAFTVVSGCLNEAVYRSNRRGGEALADQERPAGTAIHFGSHYVHDVRNLSDEPAVSVHAYSRPLTSMNYYDVDDDGRLRRLLTLQTDDPEAAPDLAGLRGVPAA